MTLHHGYGLRGGRFHLGGLGIDFFILGGNGLLVHRGLVEEVDDRQRLVVVPLGSVSGETTPQPSRCDAARCGW